MLIVTESNLDSVLEIIRAEDKLALDTETTGLKVYQSDRLFSIIVATGIEEFYFNFNDVPDHLGKLAPVILNRGIIPLIVGAIIKAKKLFLANAKFDMAMLEKEVKSFFPNGISWNSVEIHDVLVIDRLLYNDHISYNLANVAKRNGMAKDERVEEYISEHKLHAKEKVPHKKTADKLKFFNLVPFDIIAPYGCKDTRITFDIGILQESKVSAQFRSIRPTEYTPYQIEEQTTKALYRMEREGVLIDEKYTQEQGAAFQIQTEQSTRRFHDETKQVFIDSAKTLSPIFERIGFTPNLTSKGNDSISDEWLEEIGERAPLAVLVRDIRDYTKNTSFYKSYLYYKDSEGLLHANVNQAGTRTGRFSMSNPNLQQMPDSPVRRSFVAPEHFVLASLDFDQQEYRMMLDYAEQMDLIQEVKNGLDVHQATANLTGVHRQQAKTLNFMLLYGGGVVKLALALFQVNTTEEILWVIWKQANGWKLDENDKKWLPMVTDELVAHNLPELLKAEGLRKVYFNKLPMVEKLISECKETAAARGYIHTWTGRRVYFKRAFAYKAPNALIQGGASDVCKIAIIGIDKLLENRKSKLLLSIHDELVLKIHESEMGLIPEVRNIMEKSFPHKHLPLTVAANVGKNLFDMEKYG